jgi:DNA (cytosine-5)-methyltransferase 1
MFNVVDLFAGPGGLSLGFEMIKNSNGERGFRTLKAIEMDPWACKTLRKNFSEDIVIEADIRKETTKNLIEKTCKGKTDIVVAGPPCQSFSLIGPRSGRSRRLDPNKYDNLYMDFIEIVKRLSPKFFVFENVKGIISKKNGNERVIDVIISELTTKMGYKCGDGKNYLLLNAADYGVPQIRERVFIIGNNIGVENPVPQKTHFDPKINSLTKWNQEMLPYVTIFDAIGDLPRVKARKTMTKISKKRKIEIEKYNEKVNSGTDHTKYLSEWKRNHMKKIEKTGKQFINFVRPSVKIPLTHHCARPQMESDIQLFTGMKEGTCAKDVFESTNPKLRKLSRLIKYDMNSFMDKYKKHKWDKPCSTIFAHLQKDGNRFIHPNQARTFTPREAARIQSFPDSFFFEGPVTKKFQQIGNAVPPLLAKKLAEAIYFEIIK